MASLMNNTCSVMIVPQTAHSCTEGLVACQLPEEEHKVLGLFLFVSHHSLKRLSRMCLVNPRILNLGFYCPLDEEIVKNTQLSLKIAV